MRISHLSVFFITLIATSLVSLVIGGLIGQYIGYDIGYERAVRMMSGGVITSNDDVQPGSFVHNIEDTSNWKTYRHEKYGKYVFELKYPPELRVFSNTFATEPQNAFHISIHNISTKENFDVYVETNTKDLKEYVDMVWQLNNNDANQNIQKEIDRIIQTTINGNPAYQFTLSGSYKSINGGGYELGKEHLYSFLSNGEAIYQINFPADDPLFKQILSTFKFLE